MHIGYLSLAYKFGKMSKQMETYDQEKRVETEMGTWNHLPTRSVEGC